MNGIDHPNVLITGCSSGIGLCTAQTLKKQGYRVFATVRKPEDVKRLENLGLESLVLDLGDSNSIRNALTEVLNRSEGRLFGLVNNAGFGVPGAVEDLTRDLLRQQFETNVFGLMELTNQVLPVMRQQGFGRIINLSSVLGLVALAYRGAYNASKFAVEALSDTLRLELRGTRIKVILIEPGPISTKFGENALHSFKQNINLFGENSAHAQKYNNIKQHREQTQKKVKSFSFERPPEAVAKKIMHALESTNPKIRYYVTVPTYLLGTLKRIMPSRALDWVAWQATRRETEFKGV